MSADSLSLVSTPGVCVNTGACGVAGLDEAVRVALGAPFVCPECGFALAPPDLRGPALRGGAWRTFVPALAAAAMAFAMAGAAWYGLVGRRQPASVTEAEDVVALSRTILTVRPAVYGFVVTGPSALEVAPAPTMPDRPFVPKAVKGGAPLYPPSLAADGRPGRVLATCTIMADGAPEGCTARSERGGRRFADAVLAWLRSGVVFAPVIRDGQAVQEVQSWRVEVTESAAARLAAMRALPAAPVTAPPAPADASRPDFPDGYADTKEAGSVTVDCLIGTDGRASDCRTLTRTGSARFLDSVMRWLRSPRTVFEPGHQSGKDVAERRSLSVDFTP